MCIKLLNAHLKSLNPARHSGSPLYFSPADDLSGGLFKPTSSFSLRNTAGPCLKKNKNKKLGLQVANFNKTYFNKTICGHLEVDTRHIVWRHMELTDIDSRVDH